MKIRDANASDVAALRRLWQDFMAEVEGETAPSPQDTDRWVSRLHAQVSSHQVLVAEDGGEILGFAGFLEHADRSFVPPAVAYLVDLYVTLAWRRRAIADELLRGVRQRAAQRGCAQVWTNTSAANLPAQRCLEQAGFEALAGFTVPGLTGQRYCQQKAEG